MKYASYATDLKFVCRPFQDMGPISMPRIFPLYKRTFHIDSLFSSTFLSATHRGNFPLLHIISEVKQGRYEALREAPILIVLFIRSVNVIVRPGNECFCTFMFVWPLLRGNIRDTKQIID